MLMVRLNRGMEWRCCFRHCWRDRKLGVKGRQLKEADRDKNPQIIELLTKT